MKKVEILDCAIRHRRCIGCPFNDFFRPDKINIKSDQEKFSDHPSQ